MDTWSTVPPEIGCPLKPDTSLILAQLSTLSSSCLETWGVWQALEPFAWQLGVDTASRFCGLPVSNIVFTQTALLAFDTGVRQVVTAFVYLWWSLSSLTSKTSLLVLVLKSSNWQHPAQT